MAKLATMVYRAGSKLAIKGLGTFDFKVVDAYAEEGEASELDTALEEGWVVSPAEAAEEGEASPSGEDTNPPTIEELKQKADELGIEYTWNIKAETLLERINEALADSE